MRRIVLLLATPCAILLASCAVEDEPAPEGPTALSCPEPGPLPFATESTEWQDPASADLLDGARPGHAALDLLGPLDGELRFDGLMGGAVEFDLEPVEDEWVSLWGWTADAGWVQHDRERTRTGDDAGEYRFRAPASAMPAGPGAVYAVLEGSGQCAPHGLFPYPPGTQVVIADIDGTLTLGDGELFEALDDPDYVPRAWPDADRLLRTWAAKGYRVVYLTGRSHPLRSMTRTWFEALELPYGPLSTAPELLSSFASVAYKSGFLRELQDELGWRIVAAYGNSASDIAGYEQGGVPKEITFTIGPEAGSDGTVSVGDQGWTQHIEDFVEPHPDAGSR